MKNLNRLLLLFSCMCITGQLWATKRIVTSLSDSENDSGSFLNILWHINEGDTITFDDSLKESTIDFNGNDYIQDQGKQCTIIGNGVTFKNGLFFPNSSSLTFKNIKFETFGLASWGDSSFSLINCSFKEGFNDSYAGHEVIFELGPNMKAYFEGCAFISKEKLMHIDFVEYESMNSEVYFTSCSFFNEATDDNPLIYSTGYNNKITFTNCVIIDKNEKISDIPVTSGGYNVIKGGLFDGSNMLDTDIHDSEMQDPLELSNDILKVKESGSAFEHLPANTTFKDSNIHLPENDILGKKIVYENGTHSGATQLTDKIIPVTEISLNHDIILLTLYQEINTTATLSVTPKPATASYNPDLLSWESKDPNIATVKDGLITAVAPGKTTITATYNDDESITASCQVEVFQHRTVTTNASSGEGSFNELLSSLQEGDTIAFMEGLGEIELTSEPKINRSITLLGNGVTLTSHNLTVASDGVVTFENMNFKNSGIFGLNNKDTLYIRNCTFEENQLNSMYEYKAAIYAPSSKALVVEGSLFVSTAKGVNALVANWSNGENVHIHLTSCSFINTANESEPISYSSPGNIIYIPYKGGFGGSNLQSPPEITLTNCVIQDNPPRNEKSASPAIAAPCIHSNGYNVIKGLIAKELKGTENAKFEAIVNELSSEKGDIVSASMQNPVIKVDNLYQVVTGRPAVGHLPATMTIPGVNFPEKDLAGNTIDYTRATHSGAVQLTTEATAALTGIKLFSPDSIVNRGITTPLEIIWSPENATSEGITWTSSNTGIATVEDGIVTATGNGEVTITAKSGETETSLLLQANNTGVNSITLNREQDTLFIGYPAQLATTVFPENAANKSLSWESSDPHILSVDKQGNLTPLTEGTATITAKSVDNESALATCTITVQKPDYTNGVFLVNEDWYTHFNGTVNYLTDNEEWLYRVIQHENPGRELGATTQFGAIYGDKFYLVSKQEKDPGAKITGSRFAVVDAKTMKLEKEFEQISYESKKGDGRSFLGVDEQTGYVATSNGIFVFNLVTKEFTGYITGSEGDSEGGNAGGPGGDQGLYTGQVGTMLRIGDRVFANHQKRGILVIDPKQHKVDTVLSNASYTFTALTQSKDGYLWAGTTSSNNGGSGGNKGENRLVKIDPWTLDMTEIQLPVSGPYANWGAWRADAFCASEKGNKLYWKNFDTGTWTGTIIYEYDIDTNTVKKFFETDDYDGNKGLPSQPGEGGYWSIYETGFRINPKTDDMYISLSQGVNQSGQYNRAVKRDSETGEVTTYAMEDYFWFPAMFVFPDNEAPEITISEEIVMQKKECVVDFSVSDADNYDMGIITSVEKVEKEDLLRATVVKNQLKLSLLRELANDETSASSELTLKVNSNGKVLEKTITVKVEKAIPVESLTLDQTSISLLTGEMAFLKATVMPENTTYKKVLFSSNDTTVASVTAEGLIKALKVGTAVVLAHSEDSSKVAACVVTVTGDFKLSKPSLTINVGDEELLTTNARTGQKVEWSSSDSSVVSVEDGLVIALSGGVSVVTANNVTTGEKASCTVMVLKQEIDIKPEVEIGETSATISFPKVKDADYYKVFVYIKKGATEVFQYSLNVGPDGSLLRSTTADLKEGNIGISLMNLAKSTKYEIKVKAIKELPNGKEVVLSDFSTDFTTGIPTANESISSRKQAVYYRNGNLFVTGLENYTCYVMSMSGQMMNVFKVLSEDDTHSVNLSGGIYIVTAVKETKQVTFKIHVE